jgi:site-specific DNA recombinase
VGVRGRWLERRDAGPGELGTRARLAAQGQVDALLVYSPDRLSRKYAYQVLLLEEFARAGVDVVFVRAPRIETPEEVLLVQFHGIIAEYEKVQMSERTRRGKRHRARCGVVNVLSGAPYGYRYVRKVEGELARYEILEPEAALVREVFRRYTEEVWPIGAIARWLTESGIPTRTRKRQWELSFAKTPSDGQVVDRSALIMPRSG